MNDVIQLLTREEFNKACLDRDGHKCVFCQATEDLCVHHIIERKLFDDGGYYVDNGATVCPRCHILAEKALTSHNPSDVRVAAGITNIILPSDLDSRYSYDKWGNRIILHGVVFSYNKKTFCKFKKMLKSRGAVVKHITKEEIQHYFKENVDADNLITIRVVNPQLSIV